MMPPAQLLSPPYHLVYSIPPSSVDVAPISPVKQTFIMPKPTVALISAQNSDLINPSTAANNTNNTTTTNTTTTTPHVSNSSAPKTATLVKRQQTQNACAACRKRKSKCNGARPACSSCLRKRTACFFDPDREGGQIASLSRRHDALAVEVADYRALYAALRGASGQDAVALLGRIRTGKAVSEVAALLQDASIMMGVGELGKDVEMTSPASDGSVASFVDDAVMYPRRRSPRDERNADGFLADGKSLPGIRSFCDMEHLGQWERR